MTWTAWLVGIAGPLVARALTYIGVGIVTITGVSEAFGGLASAASGYFGAMPAAVLQLAGLAGLPVALGMVFGAFNARLALWIATSATRWIVK